jgi:polysaccharide export outer membrane protein
VVSVRVYGQDGMGTHARIRADGKISLPFLNDVEAAGYTPQALAQQLQTRLKDYVNVPVVTVSLEESKPLSISVLGLVGKQGVVQVEQGTGLSQLLAMVGGLNDFAHKDRIFVVRHTTPGEEAVRIRFMYEKITRSEGRAGQFVLKAGDVVIVE